MKLHFLYLIFPLILHHASCQEKKSQATVYESKEKGRDTAINIPTTIVKAIKSQEDWRNQLDKESFYVLREHGTERAFSGKYWDQHEKGIYCCKACQLPLFNASDKFDSGTGWPSFTNAIQSHLVSEKTDNSYGMQRVEVLCAQCDGHLGHVFDDGPKPTGKRFCINSVSLDFVKNASIK
ncbi:MAG: peptide-methionine (R)-S-oxide reductase MsrB [Saprospiraceae bacterium]|nr:peptide-methionine (R)-S-oxide reductase MsrB [Saprospiraceae bacterium]